MTRRAAGGGLLAGLPRLLPLGLDPARRGARSHAGRARLRHVAYAGGWKKFEPLWDLLIRRSAPATRCRCSSACSTRGRAIVGATGTLRTQSAAMRKALLLLASLLSAGAAAWADEPTVVLLWPDGAPGSEGRSEPEKVRQSDGGERVVSGVHRPSLTVYLPDAAEATGAGILVMPGGGHRELWTDHEGHRVAAWLSTHGVSAFVLKYRLAREEGSRYTVEDHALADSRRALRTVRQRAGEWRVDPQRLGVMGFSAGGELAALAAMRDEAGRADATDPIDRESSRPAFQVLVYPGRSVNILPTPQSPPAFLLCGADDRPDIAEGLASVYLRFKQAGVSGRAPHLCRRRPRVRVSCDQHRTGGPLAGSRPRVDGRPRPLEEVTEVEMRFHAGRPVASFVIVLLAAGALGAEDKAAAIESLLKRHQDIGAFNGAALVAENGKVIYKKGYGLANFEWNIPNTPDTKFRLGSITKQFTATLILQLVERGQAQARRASSPSPARLPQGHRRTGHDPPPADAHLRHPQLHGPAELLRGREPRSVRGRGLRQKVLQRRSRVRAGLEVSLQQLRLLPARRDHREAHGQDLRARS